MHPYKHYITAFVVVVLIFVVVVVVFVTSRNIKHYCWVFFCFFVASFALSLYDPLTTTLFCILIS